MYYINKRAKFKLQITIINIGSSADIHTFL